jgi:O-antigen/teichoic acid export membrane protein
LSAESSRLFRATSVADSLGIYLPASVGYRLIGLVRGVILAWLLTAAEFGLLQVAVVVVNVLIPLASAGLCEAVARYVPQYEARHALRPFLRRAWAFSALVAAVLCGLFFLAAGPLTRLVFASYQQAGTGAGQRVGLTRWAAATALILIVYWLVLGALKGLRMFLAVGLLELAGGASFTLAAVATGLAGARSADAMMAVQALAYAGVVGIIGSLLCRHLRRLPDQCGSAIPLAIDGAAPAVWAQLVRFSIWSALAGVLWQAMQYYPMWYLQKTHGPEATAVFGGVRLITQAVLIAATSVIMVVQAAVTRTWEAQGRQAADRQLGLAFKMTALFMLLGCGVLAVAAPLLIRLFPAGYGAGVQIIPEMLAFFMVGGHLAFVVLHFVLIEKTRYVFGLWLVGVLGNAAFARWLVGPELAPAAALHAAAWAGLLGITAALTAGLVWMRIERRPLDFGSALLLACTFALVLPGYVLGLLLVLLFVVVLGSTRILDGQDKAKVRNSASRLARRVFKRNT